MTVRMANMSALRIGKLSFRNPVITASGTYGMGDEYTDFADYSRLGGITTKTVTPQPRKGNPPPRILETPCGLLNSIGLENEGFKKVLSDLKKNDVFSNRNTNVIFSVAGDEPGDFAVLAAAFAEIPGIDMIEINLSCPNVHSGACSTKVPKHPGRAAASAGSATFDSDKKTVKKIVSSVRKALKKPFTVKLSPAQDLSGNAVLAQDCGADAVTVSNTFVGTAIDLKTGKFIFKNRSAGFSGPAVKPMALWNVCRVAQAVKIPVIASGGIACADDAKEFLLAGAKFVSIGTMNFVDPGLAARVAGELRQPD